MTNDIILQDLHSCNRLLEMKLYIPSHFHSIETGRHSYHAIDITESYFLIIVYNIFDKRAIK